MEEVALDRCFWREVSTSASFRNWLLGKTKFAGRTLELVSNEYNEKWHQRWYKDPETKKDSETDILLIFRDTANAERYALHIENKPAHRAWEPIRQRITARERQTECVPGATLTSRPYSWHHRRSLIATLSRWHTSIFRFHTRT